MNTGFYTRAREITKRKFESKNIWKLQMDKDVPYHVAFLTPYYLNLAVHYIQKAPQAICNKMYFKEGDPDAFCAECLKPGYMGEGLNRPSQVKVMIGYVFDLEGAKGRTSKGTEFDHDPVKLIQVSSGKGEENFEKLNEAIIGGYLQFDSNEKNIWRLKAKSSGGMITPTMLTPLELKSNPALKKAEIPQETWNKFSKLSKGEAEGLIVNAFGNLDREFLEQLGMIFPPNGEDFYSSRDSDENEEDM